MLTFKERALLLDAPMFPGRVKQFTGSRYFKDADGNLRVIGFFMEKGWMLFLIPFTDHHEHELILEAVDRAPAPERIKSRREGKNIPDLLYRQTKAG